jgi:hypothetical protein
VNFFLAIFLGKPGRNARDIRVDFALCCKVSLYISTTDSSLFNNQSVLARPYGRHHSCFNHQCAALYGEKILPWLPSTVFLPVKMIVSAREDRRGIPLSNLTDEKDKINQETSVRCSRNNSHILKIMESKFQDFLLATKTKLTDSVRRFAVAEVAHHFCV